MIAQTDVWMFWCTDVSVVITYSSVRIDLKELGGGRSDVEMFEILPRY